MKKTKSRIIKLITTQIWPPNAWKTMGWTWLWLTWWVFPQIVILNFLMTPGLALTAVIGITSLLLCYGSLRSIIEGLTLYRDNIMGIQEMILLIFAALPPLLTGFLGVASSINN